MRSGFSSISRRSLLLKAGVVATLGVSAAAVTTSHASLHAPGNPLPLESEEALALAQQYADAQAGKNPDALVALFFDDGVYVDTQNPSNGLRQGRDQIGEYFRQVYHSYPSLVFTIDSVAMHQSIDPPWSMVAGVMWTFNGVHAESSEIAGEATDQQVFISGYDQLVISRGQDSKPLITSAYSYYSGQDFVDQDQVD